MNICPSPWVKHLPSSPARPSRLDSSSWSHAPCGHAQWCPDWRCTWPGSSWWASASTTTPSLGCGAWETSEGEIICVQRNGEVNISNGVSSTEYVFLASQACIHNMWESSLGSYSKSVWSFSSLRGWKVSDLFFIPNMQAESGVLAKIRPVRQETESVLQ